MGIIVTNLASVTLETPVLCTPIVYVNKFIHLGTAQAPQGPQAVSVKFSRPTFHVNTV